MENLDKLPIWVKLLSLSLSIVLFVVLIILFVYCKELYDSKRRQKLTSEECDQIENDSIKGWDKFIIVLLISTSPFIGCKKTGQVDGRLIPNNTHVWLIKANRPSYKAMGLDVDNYWVIDSLTSESFTSYNMNFYTVHNEKQQHTAFADDMLQLHE